MHQVQFHSMALGGCGMLAGQVEVELEEAIGDAIDDEGAAGVVQGAHGFLIAYHGAAIADAGKSGIRPAVTRYHVR